MGSEMCIRDRENFLRMREEQAGTLIEREGKELRSMMDWIDQDF